MGDVDTAAGPLAQAAGAGPSTLCQAFQSAARRAPDAVALRTLDGSQALTWAQYAEQVRRIAGGLAEMGVGRGDTVALMLTNRPEFNLVDTAAVHLGAVPFSIYNTSAPEQIAHLLDDAGPDVVIAEQRFVEQLQDASASVGRHVVVLEDGLPDAAATDFEERWRAVQPDDVATLIYTSGTTGPPKGVQLTHRNLLSGFQSWTSVLPFRPGGRLLSYLPAAHLADRFHSHYASLITGSTVISAADMRELTAALVAAQPTMWMGVPRVWEKMRAALMAEGLVDPAALSEEAKAAVRARLGFGDVDWVGAGAAPLGGAELDYFAQLGLTIHEGWAMSETSSAGLMNPPGATRAGTVGKPLPGVEIRVADDGELLVRGDNVMSGYKDDPERTAEALEPDGWLHTGDIVEIEPDGYVTIVDRKKDLIINSAGKNMSPANIERHLKNASPLIGQACVVGDRRPYNVALLVLDPDVSAAHARTHELSESAPAALATDPGVQQIVSAAVAEANSHLSRVEQVKKFVVLPVDWLPGGDELTPTAKLRRRPIAEKYAVEIDALYH